MDVAIVRRLTHWATSGRALCVPLLQGRLKTRIQRTSAAVATALTSRIGAGLGGTRIISAP